MVETNHPNKKGKHTLVTLLFVPVHFVLRNAIKILRKWSKAAMDKAMKPEFIQLIEGLDPEMSYSLEAIAQKATENQQKRCQGALKNFKMYHKFPPGGDTVAVTDHGKVPEWYGHRWQKSLQRQIGNS